MQRLVKPSSKNIKEKENKAELHKVNFCYDETDLIVSLHTQLLCHHTNLHNFFFEPRNFII